MGILAAELNLSSCPPFVVGFEGIPRKPTFLK